MRLLYQHFCWLNALGKANLASDYPDPDYWLLRSVCKLLDEITLGFRNMYIIKITCKYTQIIGNPVEVFLGVISRVTAVSCGKYLCVHLWVIAIIAILSFFCEKTKINVTTTSFLHKPRNMTSENVALTKKQCELASTVGKSYFTVLMHNRTKPTNININRTGNLLL